MLKSKIHIILIITLMLAGTARMSAQTVPPATDEDKLIAVIQSSDATHKEKVDACRGLALIGTEKSIAPLVALLGDEKLSHMARYALETIKDPAVDEVLRDALGKLRGTPLVGVIGSVGVRRDAKAVETLTKMLRDSDAVVAQAAARALGSIGNSTAASALENELKRTSGQNKLNVCEGLFRCAETAVAEGRKQQAIEIYDQLRKLDDPHQVCGGAVRGAILTRQKEGLPLLKEYLRSDSYILFSAACQTALEMSGTEVTQALTAALNDLPVDKEILVIWTLGKRGDPAAVPALSAAAGSGEKSVRIVAIEAMPQIGHASAVPVLADLLADNDSEISKAAEEALAAIPGDQADAAIMAMLNNTETEPRLMALELIGRRRMTSSVPALLKAAEGPDAKVRQAALKRVGELGSPAEFSALLELLVQFESRQDLDAAEQALSAVCAKADNPASYTSKITNQLTKATPAQKSALLRVLSIIGGTDALNAVRKAAKDSNAQVSDAAIRVLCSWKTADAAPDLLALAKNSSDNARKTAALRGYINLARDGSLSTSKKLEICRQAAALIQRDEEKKLLLGALSTVPALEALSMAMAHIEEPAIRDEAAFAAVAIGEQIAEQKPREVIEAMQKALKATNNTNVNRRGRMVLNKAKQAAGQ
ncbi:MAG: HEAT repeat domain-containing protein [Sedimentisphaerales bacterium]|nr:HEAT repeat domain-containing protein [Sedimentisphaerales bacterium]